MAWGLVIDNSLTEEEFEGLVDVIVELDKKDFFIWFIEGKDSLISNYGLDPLLVGSYLCQLTSHLQIGLILDPFIRPPSWLAKNLVTLDLICKGRLHIGLQFSQPIHSEFLEETLRVFNGLFQGGPFSFAGKSQTLNQAMSLPLPYQKPRPSLWIQGHPTDEMENMVDGLIAIGDAQFIGKFSSQKDNYKFNRLKHFLILKELADFEKVRKSVDSMVDKAVFGLGFFVKSNQISGHNSIDQIKDFLYLTHFGQ